MIVEQVVKIKLDPEEKHAIKVLASITCPGIECDLCPMYAKSLIREDMRCCILTWAKDMNTFKIGKE